MSFKSSENETACSPTYKQAGKECAIIKVSDWDLYEFSTLYVHELYGFSGGQTEGTQTHEETHTETKKQLENPQSFLSLDTIYYSKTVTLSHLLM